MAGARQAADPPEAELDGDRRVPPVAGCQLAVVKPRVLVCLGATAAQALLGKSFRVSQSRGELVDSPLAEVVTATVHPSSILRAEDREAEYETFVADLKQVAKHL
jgi:uracil-DNA glycosylase